MLTHSELIDLLDYNQGTGIFNWRYSRGGSGSTEKPAGHLTDRGYRRMRVLGKNYFAQRLAWFHVKGDWPPEGFQVDHINGVKDDNRWINLRLATPEENSRNCGPQSNNKLGIKGVVQRGNRFEAFLYYDKSLKRIGIYDTIEEAESAYIKRASEIHKEFSYYY